MGLQRLTAITVSVNYSDFLVHSIEANRELFDRWIIVTDFADHKTKKLLEDYDIEHIQTNAFYDKGVFNKYAGINKAIEWTNEDDWILFLDSDIVLQKDTRRVLSELELHKDCIYGVDRLNIEGYNNWKKFKESPGLLKEYWLLHTGGLPMGARLVHLYGVEGENGKFGGYNPLGFFQLAHRSHFNHYPDDTIGADHCDLLFSRLWPRSRRVLIPEMFAIHLESDASHKAINWYGRKSAPFVEFIEKIEDKIEKVVEKVEEKIEDIFKHGCNHHPEY